MNNSHDFEQNIYDCDCGTWWIGDQAASGCTEDGPQECPRCGENVQPTVETVD